MKFPKRNKICDNKSFNLKHNYTQTTSFKPNGLWYAYYSGWYNYIMINEMPERLYKYIHKIEINKNVLTDINHTDKNKLLLIKNTKDFDKFHKKYRADGSEMLGLTSTKFNNDLIDWQKVANDFGGIEFYPYLKNRKNYIWYNTWDIASGCIWNVSKVINRTVPVYKKVKNVYQKIQHKNN